MFPQTIHEDGAQLSIPQLEFHSAVFPFLADHHLPYIVPAIVFWAVSLSFHYIDTRGYLSKYKLHTPAEDLTKNRATKKDVIKFALLQQAAQCTLGYLTAGEDPHISDDYGIALWAQKIRDIMFIASRIRRLAGLDVTWRMTEPKGYGLGSTAALTGSEWVGHVANFSQRASAQVDALTLDFSSSELVIAKLIYWILVPLFQYVCAMVMADTFQYFTHRAFHVNRWLYKHIHSMHHDVYVPFAYGAFYNHPLETIPIDCIGFPLCLSIAGLNNRQSAIFGAIWTFKTVVDHCGYDFPYNPCNIVCPHSVHFHDLHHQTWGMKYNFSVYGSFWDWLMGTHWSPLDEKAREKYSRGKAIAESLLEKAKPANKQPEMTAGNSTGVEI